MEILHNLGKLVTQNKVYVASEACGNSTVTDKIFNLGDLIYIWYGHFIGD